MSTKKIYHPRLLKTVVLDITDCATFVEADLDHLLRKAEAGIYLRQTSQIVISSQDCRTYNSYPKYYYHDNASRSFVAVDHEINCIADIRGPIFNSALDRIISATMLTESSNFLTEGPLYPIIGLQAVEFFIGNYIARQLRWQKLVPDAWIEMQPLMAKYWHDPYTQVSDLEWSVYGDNASNVADEVNRRMTDSLSRLLESIDSILASDDQQWAIVRSHRSLNKLRVQVYEDYRICEWMNEHDQGRNLESLLHCDEILGDDIARLWSTHD